MIHRFRYSNKNNRSASCLSLTDKSLISYRKMAKTFHINGYSEFNSKIKEIATGTEILYAYFTGKKDESGKSWCPDCNDAEPFLKDLIIAKGKPNTAVAIVDVGDRPEWKSKTCPFRTNRDTHLSVIPTLINWNDKSKRLEGDQLLRPELIEMFLEQEPTDD